MRIHKKEAIKLIGIACLLICVLLPLKFMYKSLAAEETYALKAILYDTVQYSEGTGTELTAEGAQVDGWQFNTSKYLQIDPKVPADGKNYTVTVKLPQEMYVVASEIVMPSGYKDVTFSKNAPVPVNDGTQTYDLHEYSGTLVYTMNNMGISGSIQLELRYDNVLWDKQANSSITADGVLPIEVVLAEVNETQTTELKNISVQKITSNNAMKFGGAVYYKVQGTSSQYTDSIELQAEQQVICDVAYSSSDYTEYMYYPELYITLQLPTYTDSAGKVYYLQPDTSTIVFKNLLTSYTYAIDTTQLDTQGKLVVELKDAYLKPGNIITFTYLPLVDELKNTDQNAFQFKKGKVTIVANGKNGNTNILLHSATLHAINYIKNVTENVVLTSTAKEVSIVERPDDAVSEFGGFYLENKGTGDSGVKHIRLEFDTGNTGKMQVTTVNVYADTVQQYIHVGYTLVDQNGQRVYLNEAGERVEETAEGAIGTWEYALKNTYYNKTTTSNLKNMLTRNMLPEAHRSYFFKSLEYTIERIQVGARLYAWQSNSALNGAGNIFGYVTEDVQDGEKFTHTIWVTSANTSIANLTKTITTTARNNSKPTYMIRNVTMSQTNIQAGESVNIQGRIEGVSYPYGNSTWIKNISLGVVLPKDVSINEQAITAVTSTKINITTFTLEKRELETGNNLWIIRFPKDICIGYATEKLGVLEGGIYITFHLQLDTSYTMNNATLFAREMLFAAGYKQQNGAGGSYSWARATDTYDLNENNSTTDYIACMDARESTNCQIVSQTAMLDVTDSISITNNANTTPESHQGAIPSPEAIIQYHLDISCSSGGHVEGFEYYIPVPKMTSGIDTFLIEEIGFDTSLIEMPQITGSDVLSVVYTFEPGLTYTSVKDVTTWYTAEEIENTETLQWEDVTMLQLTMKNGVMENGDKTRVTLQTKYTGTQFPEEAGMQNVWHSGGFYVHINGDRETAGNYATIGASVMLHYAIENPDIILTAAKNGVPQVEGNVAEQTIGENFPMFIHAHNFSVVEIETYNVTLQTKAYMQSNVEMSGNEANRTFAITAGIAEKEVDIVEDNKTNSIGTSTAGASPIIRFAIYNGNQLSDNAVSRYIVVTLQSDKGVTVKQKIIINRELERATDPKSAIVSGKRYMTFDDTSTEVTISKDSAFTAQFITSYIPNNYGEHSLQFSQILPADTTIVLANVTDENNPMYYYYVADGTTKEIHFTQCVQMGTIQTKNYAYYTGEESVEEKILVIVDFANVASEHLEVGDYTLQIAIKGNGVENYTSKILGFSTTEKRAFSLESEETITAGETSSIQYTMTQQVGVESKYEGRKLALILIPPENIPEDTSVTANGQMYYLNIHRQYIIPLGEVQAVNGNIDVIVQSAAWPQSGADYMWNMELWVAATANAQQPMMGEKVANKTVAVSVKRMLQPALKIMDSDTRILHQQDTQKEILLTYQYIQDAECTVTIELMQKVGSGYQRITDKLNQVAGNTTHHMGVFDIPSTTGKQQIRLKFASAMELGTYRLQLKVYDNNKEQLLSIPYNFMVVL